MAMMLYIIIAMQCTTSKRNGQGAVLREERAVYTSARFLWVLNVRDPTREGVGMLLNVRDPTREGMRMLLNVRDPTHEGMRMLLHDASSMHDQIWALPGFHSAGRFLRHE
jgi:hypothetical protein